MEEHPVSHSFSLIPAIGNIINVLILYLKVAKPVSKSTNPQLLVVPLRSYLSGSLNHNSNVSCFMNDKEEK